MSERLEETINGEVPADGSWVGGIVLTVYKNNNH